MALIDFSGALAGGGGIVGLGLSFLVFGFLAIVLVGGGLFFYLRKKKWYLNVEFKIPRSDGKLVNSEWGRGAYDRKKGVVFVKRKGIKKSALKPFDVKRYIQGNNTITVVQVGIDTYIPVIQSSYIEMIDDKTGEEAALMETRIDLSENLAWKSQFEREAKTAYTIESLLLQFLPFIGWGLVIFLNFLGFAILYTRIT